MSALSDSTTRTMSPESTRSPTPISQLEILPSFIVDERAGMVIMDCLISIAGTPARNATTGVTELRTAPAPSERPNGVACRLQASGSNVSATANPAL